MKTEGGRWEGKRPKGRIDHLLMTSIRPSTQTVLQLQHARGQQILPLLLRPPFDVALSNPNPKPIAGYGRASPRHQNQRGKAFSTLRKPQAPPPNPKGSDGVTPIILHHCSMTLLNTHQPIPQTTLFHLQVYNHHSLSVGLYQ